MRAGSIAVIVGGPPMAVALCTADIAPAFSQQPQPERPTDNLEAAADTAARLNRWEFLLMAAPLRVAGGTGSPINPIAVF